MKYLLDDDNTERDVSKEKRFQSETFQKLIQKRVVRFLGKEKTQNTGDGDKELIETLESKRGLLFMRLQGISGNPFHNLRHALDVHKRTLILLENLRHSDMISSRRKLLILEAALRHDDGHSGTTYRQDVVDGGEMSNEEFATYLLENDFRDSGLSDEDLQFIKRCILASTFGQGKLPREDPKFRNYRATTLEEKLLVFADVGGALLYGLNSWKAEGEKVYKENGMPTVHDKNWLARRKGFFAYVLSLYKDIRDVLSDELTKKIDITIPEIEKYLSDEERYLEEV